LRLYCGLLRRGQAVEAVYEGNVGPGNQVPVGIYGELNRAVPHLIAHIRERSSGLNQQAAKDVAQVVKTNLPQSGLGKQWFEDPMSLRRGRQTCGDR